MSKIKITLISILLSLCNISFAEGLNQEIKKDAVDLNIASKEDNTSQDNLVEKEKNIDNKTKEDNDKIRELVISFNSALNKKNKDLINLLITEHATLITTKNISKGYSETKKILETEKETDIFKIKSIDLNDGFTVEIGQNWAKIYGKGTEKVNQSITYSDLSVPVNWMALLVKDQDNNWKINSFVTSVNYLENPILIFIDEMVNSTIIICCVISFTLGILFFFSILIIRLFVKNRKIKD